MPTVRMIVNGTKDAKSACEKQITSLAVPLALAYHGLVPTIHSVFLRGPDLAPNVGRMTYLPLAMLLLLSFNRTHRTLLRTGQPGSPAHPVSNSPD